jgi:hypothetical protein
LRGIFATLPRKNLPATKADFCTMLDFGARPGVTAGTWQAANGSFSDQY